MTFAEALVNLNIDLNDTDNFTFTAEEKTRALEEAWRDSYNTANVWDETTTYSSSTYSYAIPASIKVVKGLYYKDASTSFPSPIDSSAWESIDGYIKISPEYQYAFIDGSTLVFKGTKQVTTTDNIAEDRIEYILKLAHLNTLRRLGAQKANRFLKNDTSMAEIIALRTALERDIAQERRRFNSGTERV